MTINKYINLKTGFIGGVFLGSVVYWINADFGWQMAGIAALKQGIYTWFFGGAIVKMCETISQRGQHKWRSILAGAAAASVVAITAILIVHHFKGTPRPFYSSLPVMTLAPLSFLVIGYRARRKISKPKTQIPKLKFQVPNSKSQKLPHKHQTPN